MDAGGEDMGEYGEALEMDEFGEAAAGAFGTLGGVSAAVSSGGASYMGGGSSRLTPASLWNASADAPESTWSTIRRLSFSRALRVESMATCNRFKAPSVYRI